MILKYSTQQNKTRNFGQEGMDVGAQNDLGGHETFARKAN